MRRRHQIRSRFVEHGAPLGRGRLRPETEKGERRRRDDGRADAHREIDEDHRDRPRKDVPKKNREIRRADASGRLHVGFMLEIEDVCAYEPRKGGHRENRHGRDDVEHSAPEHGDDPDRQQNPRKREEHVGDPRDDAVDPSFVVARKKSEHRADQGARQYRKKTAEKRNPRSRENAAEDVAPERVDPEPVEGGGTFVQVIVVKVVFRIEGREMGPEDRKQKERRHQDRGRHAYGIAAKPPAGVRPGRADAGRNRHRLGGVRETFGRFGSFGRFHFDLVVYRHDLSLTCFRNGCSGSTIRRAGPRPG